MIKYMAVAVAVAVSGGVGVPVAVPVAVAGLTKRFLNQKDFLIIIWGYLSASLDPNFEISQKNVKI